MKTTAAPCRFEEIDAIVLIKFCQPSALKKDPIIKSLNIKLNGAIGEIFSSGEFEGKLNQTLVLHSIPEIPAKKIILAGLGAETPDGFDHYRQSAGTVSALPALENRNKISIYIDGGEEKGAVQAVMEGLILRRFKLTDYKTGDNVKKDQLQAVNIYSDNRRKIPGFQKKAEAGRIVAEGVILARTLTSHPGNMLTPKKFSSKIQLLSKKFGLGCTVLDEKELASEKMGALLSVAQGSKEPARFVIIEYKGGRAKSKPIVLIGKGITFDSGGISLKPPLNMGEMKGDMQGAAIVVSILMAVAGLKLPLNIVGLIPMAENLPSSKATKPGDIVTSRKGKTIEVINTDAEGRLILADALDYADKFNPQAVVDIATLTGAAQYVLGEAGIPIMGNNSRLMDVLRDASKRCAEKVWELPIWDEYGDMMKSTIADLKNSGGKLAGTLTAAAFLKNFIGKWPWGHIDIAAVDIEKEGKPYTPKGISAMGMRLLVEMLSGWRKL